MLVWGCVNPSSTAALTGSVEPPREKKLLCNTLAPGGGVGVVLSRQAHSKNKEVEGCGVACHGHAGSATSISLDAASLGWNWKAGGMKTDDSLDSSGVQDSCVVMQNIHLKEVGAAHAGEQQADRVRTSHSDSDM